MKTILISVACVVASLAPLLAACGGRLLLERADVAIVLLDAAEGVTALDSAIAGYALEQGCSIILVLNKWDLLEGKDTASGTKFEQKVRQEMKFLSWAPVITTSALSGQRVQKLLPLAVRANAVRGVRIPTSSLNDFFEREVRQRSGVTRSSCVWGGPVGAGGPLDLNPLWNRGATVVLGLLEQAAARKARSA